MHAERSGREAQPFQQNNSAQERMRSTKRLMHKLAIVFSALAIVVVIGVLILIKRVIVPMNYYNQGVDLMYRGQYAEAIERFSQTNGFQDSEKQILICESYLNENDK